MTEKTAFNRIARIALLFIAAGMLFFNPLTAMACGFGNSGGSDYVPQRQSAYSGNQPADAIDQEQVKGIVENQINRLNPDLAVGSINDVGSFYEVEVINQSNEVLQLLGVDKYSGRMMLLN